MLVELYSYLSNLPRYHVFFVVSVGYLGYYLLEVVKVSQLNTKVQKRDVPRSAIMQVTLRLSIITHFDFLELITRSVLIRFFLSPIFTLQRPILAAKEGPFRRYLLKNIPILDLKYWPTFWCIESRAQTVFASFLRASVLPTLDYQR